MEYSEWTIRQLQEECKRRGLPSGRAKAELVQRLAEHDATDDASAPEQPADTPETPAEAAPEPAPVTSPPTAAGQAPAGSTFRKPFPAEPGGPDEETHLAYRQATLQAAAAAGLTPRGDAHLADTTGGVWVYEVHVRSAP